ncbi:MAG: hypothetical protein Q7R35_12015 [Elusimicrobiota bacterium]|nr:hypothetical protein [Elusimicrobiota bacterium]
MKMLVSILLLAASPAFAAGPSDFYLDSASGRDIAAGSPAADITPVPAAPAGVKQNKNTVSRGIDIQGSGPFSAKTREALTLLEGSTTFTKVIRYIEVIEEADHSGMAAFLPKPTYQVGSRTWTQPVAWYAGTIAHDGYHSLLYHEYEASAGKAPPAEAWTGARAERDCLSFQQEVLTEIKAVQYVNYVQGLMADPTYQNIPYSQRNW